MAGISIHTTPWAGWRISPSLSLDRTRTYIPTRADWNPFDLGELEDTQEGMTLGTEVRFFPSGEIFGGRDAITLDARKTWRRRTGYKNTQSSVFLNYTHTF